MSKQKTKQQRPQKNVNFPNDKEALLRSLLCDSFAIAKEAIKQGLLIIEGIYTFCESPVHKVDDLRSVHILS